MTTFIISIAGVPMHVTALYESTARYCAEYLCDETPQIELTVSQEDIEYERAKSAREDAFNGLPRSHSDRNLETLALYRKIAAALLSRGVLLFHGAVIAYDGKAYLIAAPSGTGKTTHCRLWLSEIPGSHILNGDKPLLRFEEDRVYACGTPWRGKEGYGRNEILPLEAVCILNRDSQNHIETVSFHDALPALLGQSNRPEDPSLMMKTLELIDRLGRLTKLYRLGCNMEPEAAHISFRAMCEGDGT